MNPIEPQDPLLLFHPLIRKWFRESVGVPTDIQSRAWSEITLGKHALVTAPTGSGKTMTAFLWAINQLVTGVWESGRIRVLYVSPLKALNNDVQRNLLSPIEELKALFLRAEGKFPPIGVLTRSGDTPADDRRQMLRRPPEILITTPESLNILLSSRKGRGLLGGITTVILDEIHAVVGTKRGTHLITAVDRLVLLSGEFQRIALSATVKPLPTVAEFVGGYRLLSREKTPHYEKRKVEIIRSKDKKGYLIEVRFPPKAREHPIDASWWPALAESFKVVIRDNHSTLLFANSRRIAEKVTRLINEGEAEELAYSHHGSLSREIRLAVEKRLKAGELKAIVATSSLELGIDIGDLDRVILIQTPPSISSAIQRIGRSGHRVGGLSYGLLYPTHGRDFLNAAVIAEGVMNQDIEAVRPIESPLDVLAQVIISMTGLEPWDRDKLFFFIKTSTPYHQLSRQQFNLVLEMLAGRYADTRLRELKPRISMDKIDNTLQGKEGVLRLIYLSGGTIPDRGYYDLRMADSKSKIGELDEEFVWERRIGDTFTLGAQVWRIQKVTHNNVEVNPAEVKPGIFPFWRAEDQNRDFHFSEKILLFLEKFHKRIDAPSFKEELVRKYFLDEAAVMELIDFLRRQKEATKTDLPHRHHLLIEHFPDPSSAAQDRQVIFHTIWGGKINRPFSLALQAAWEEKYHTHLEVIQNNDGILVILPHDFSAGELLALVKPENLEKLLRQSLEKSGFFGAKFRENAGRALLLPRSDFKKRLPLWLNRLRSKKLMDAIMAYPDFPLLLETWRTCLQDEFDLENLKKLLEEIRNGRIKISDTFTSAASPFADGLIWKHTSTYMYADDSPLSGKTSGLSQELLKEVVFSHRLRPRLAGDLVRSLEAKLQRTAPGYAPRSAQDLLDWIKERILIPASEWQELMRVIDQDREIPARDMVALIQKKIFSIRLPAASTPLICALENLERLVKGFNIRQEEVEIREVPSNGSISGRTDLLNEAVFNKYFSGLERLEENGPADILLQWLSFYGPVGRSSLKEILGLEESYLDEMISSLAESHEIVFDRLTEKAQEMEICDRENLEILLRMARKSRQPLFKALGIDHLSLFLATYQGLTKPGDSADDLQRVLDQLFGFPSDVEAWEKHILPARLFPYYGTWLDNLSRASDLLWFGCGKRRICFSFPADLELFVNQYGQEGVEQTSAEHPLADELVGLLPRKIGRYSFFDLARFSNLESRPMTKKIWDLFWKGLISNDSFATLRQGILTQFAPFPLKRDEGRPSRSAFNRWVSTRPLSGNWYVLDLDPIEKDPIDEAERVKDRVRQLFRRYGLIFRELLVNELPMLQWNKVFKALRLMELSGEILSGHFFEGIPGIQFISPEAFQFLNESLPEKAVYWLNATDPASLCGLKLETLKGRLPSRIPSTYLVYQGHQLVVISRRNGGHLEFRVPPDDPFFQGYLAFFKILLTREFSPEKIISIERINGKPALESEYLAPLKAFGFTRSHKGLELVRGY
jgi:ATP-dependent helicase Lhr and Lhr-like helicase